MTTKYLIRKINQQCAELEETYTDIDEAYTRFDVLKNDESYISVELFSRIMHKNSPDSSKKGR